MRVEMADENPALGRQDASREDFVLGDSNEQDVACVLPVAVIDAPYLAVAVNAGVRIGDVIALVYEQTVAPRLAVVGREEGGKIIARTPLWLVGQRYFVVYKQKPSRWQTADEEP